LSRDPTTLASRRRRIVAASDASSASSASGAAHAAAHAAAGPQHEVSLRAYLEVLYYCDRDVTPPMRISLRGTLVAPRNWSVWLRHWPPGRAPYSYTPASLRDESDDKAYGAHVRFGTKRPLEEALTVLGVRGGHGDVAAKRDIMEHTGVYYYNHVSSRRRASACAARVARRSARSTRSAARRRAAASPAVHAAGSFDHAPRAPAQAARGAHGQ
jgi:hypothetical protein